MKKSLAFLAIGFALASLPLRAMPLNETDYLSSEEEHFRAADVDKSGYIELPEAQAAFTNVELMPNETARAACSKAGKNISAQYRPDPHDKNYRPMNFDQFMQSRKSMFNHIDANHDHIITQAEMDAFSNQMIKICTVAPQMMQDLKDMQNSDTLRKMTPEERAKMLERLRILQGKEPTKQ